MSPIIPSGEHCEKLNKIYCGSKPQNSYMYFTTSFHKWDKFLKIYIHEQNYMNSYYSSLQLT